VRVAVLGPGDAATDLVRLAEAVGFELARRGAVVVCGGLDGCMAGAARGVRRAGGTCLGILPGYDPEGANPDVDLPIPTGLGEARNAIVVAGSEAAIAVGGGPGTLSEIALALKLGRPVVGLRTWALRDPSGGGVAIHRARTAAAAAGLALSLAKSARRPRHSSPAPRRS
jgi:uncharacterized protein (TIGR00725 family)